ncbi:MAG: undecaprenyl-diphosphatase UppP [Candidatus Kapabacteria bacterium]|jgi:undecaprenyl-diphosphatase|nr:undecaprenyl-diphosphatase UppP [Candidatus Kapabacteria bacterium]
MTIFQAIILGIVQGLTEFLPVSSSAHLTLVGKAMGLISPEHPEAWTAFIAVIQLGTLLAVLIYFAQDIVQISTAFLRENIRERKQWHTQSQESRMGWYVIIGTVPIVTIGLALKKIIESNITKNVTIIAWTLIILALVLFIAERLSKQQRGLQEITWRDALIIGVAQTLALFPGASRSGTTITAGLFIGLKRDVAARFSFLLSIPAVLASGLLQLKQSLEFMNTQDMTTLLVATVVSGISGYAAIALLLRYLQTHSTAVFVIYRIALGIALLTIWKTLL